MLINVFLASNQMEVWLETNSSIVLLKYKSVLISFDRFWYVCFIQIVE